MKREKAYRKIHIGARWILLVSVLAGIFLSNGEGVHLLPFPDAEHQGPLDASGSPGKSYAFSILQLSNSAATKVKSQKKAKKDIPLERVALVEPAYIGHARLLQDAVAFDRHPMSLPDPYLLLRLGRAPPPRFPFIA